MTWQSLKQEKLLSDTQRESSVLYNEQARHATAKAFYSLHGGGGGLQSYLPAAEVRDNEKRGIESFPMKNSPVCRLTDILHTEMII